MPHKSLLLKDFKLPKTVLFERDELETNYGRFIIAPFERGYGITVANSLRRTLLSSIQGYAITAIRIEYYTKERKQAVLSNEFEAIYGMYEDTLDFIQNLKQVRLKLLDDSENRTIMIEKKGDHILKAADLEVDANIKIFNPELYLATLNEDCDITMELQIDFGRGYVPAERNIEYVKTIGTIPIDAIFTPVLKVNYDIENYRIGQRTDYEKIVLEVWTDGTVRPDDAVSDSARILKEYYSHFINFEEKEIETEPIQIAGGEEKESLDNKPIEELELSVRSSNCLKMANIKTIGDLKQKTDDELSKIKNLGKKSLDEIMEKLNSMGIKLKTKEAKEEKED
jgi:DNA-directed RNA polymerase subunit alpha